MTNPSVYPRGYRPRHAADGPDSTPAAARRRADWRPEIQGLRAVAVLLVVVFHIFTDRVSGGVDIFLFISAFFLTGSFTRKMESGRPLAVGRYWLHVFTRLMPMAVLTILLTLVAVATVYPLADRASWRTEALASALYVENWTLAFNAVDYYAADNTSLSPFQHFWSLSVQGQVFILWPLLFLVSALVARRTGARPRAVLTTAFASVFVVSLLWSVTQTSQNQAFTYFDTRARLWEFALGSLLALALPFLHLGRRTRVFLGWAGLASMIAVGVVVDVQGAFPGWIALWPLMSATAVIVAGTSGSHFGVDRVLASRPLTRLGDSAYALYLIHWPLLITYSVLTGSQKPGAAAGVVLVVVSLGAALLLSVRVERPLRAWGWPQTAAWRSAVVLGACAALVVAPVTLWRGAEAAESARVLEAADRNNPGAAVLRPDYEPAGDPGAPVLPVVEGRYPFPEYPEECDPALEAQLTEVGAESCHVLVPQADPAGVVLMAGNSHVMQWSPALRRLGEERRLEVVSYTRGSCLVAPMEEQVDDSPKCPDFLADLNLVVEHVRPDVVFMQGTRSTYEDEEMLTPGMTGRMEEIAGTGAHVLALRDNPRFAAGSPTTCGTMHGVDAVTCRWTHAVLDPNTSPLAGLADAHPRIAQVQLNDMICPDRQCQPTVGNVHVYWDDNHLTPTYVETLAPVFIERVLAALEHDGMRLGR